VELIRLQRHGVPHHIAPHAVNYRANVAALAALEVDAIVSLNTVGGIAPEAVSGAIVVPDQLIDYTWGRASTFSADDGVRHVDFSSPYDAELRTVLVAAGQGAAFTLVPGGVMGVTQGPRLETAAEIRRMAQDGCAVVGMTGMPEAALARELDIRYVSVSLVVNPAAGVGPDAVLDLDDIQRVAREGMRSVADLLDRFLERLG
jgi:purine nucleoside phosphorylase